MKKRVTMSLESYPFKALTQYKEGIHKKMIQDIAPHKFDITYQYKKPGDNNGRADISLIFSGDRILVRKLCGDKKEAVCEMLFPTYSQVSHLISEQTYLFSMDGVDYYRGYIEPEKADDVYNLSAEDFQNDSNVNDEKTENSCAEMWEYEWQNRSFFRTVKPKELALAGITGMHLNGWYTKNKFCGACGGELVPDSRERMLKCPKCGNMVFPRINPAVIVGIINGDKILLTKYRGREYKKYALVAGFTEIGESFEDTVRREVMEEVGLKVKNIRYYKSQPWGFADNILAGFFCEVDGDTTITMDREELSIAEWVSREDIQVQFEDMSLTNEMIYSFKVDKAI